MIALGAVGLELPRRLYYDKELSFRVSRSYGPGRYDPSYEEAGIDYPAGYVRWTEGRNLQAVLSLIEQGQLDVRSLITHRIPIDKAPRAYSLISGKSRAPFLGVVLTYPQAETVAASKRIELRRPAAGTTVRCPPGRAGCGQLRRQHLPSGHPAQRRRAAGGHRLRRWPEGGRLRPPL